MNNTLGGLSAVLENGVWLIAIAVFKYILLPEFIAAILFGGILKVKGVLFKIIMFIVTLISAYLFFKFGLQEIANGV